ncbi:MAG: hypothetical protein GC151_18440 [Betaproteobacteria bacterium]|nr:hypothetical protein [Betaproteobacteria bacterium]
MQAVERTDGPGASSGWLLLIVTMSGEQSALRMRTWRGLKALGVGVVRDGVYVLPDRPDLKQALQRQADEVLRAGGKAQLIEVAGANSEFQMLFDRTVVYAEFIAAIKAAERGLKKAKPGELSRAMRRLCEDFENIVSQDFFPGAAQRQAKAQLDAFTFQATQVLAPGEPHARSGVIPKLRVPDYQGRIWATRKRPWVDRLASGWFIHRFVDRNARIRWLEKPEDCPKRALGFDFDGAAFTHVGEKVTFEVLCASFDLESDVALEKVGAIVHYLDVGGIPVPEAPGFETIIRGMQRRCSVDDELLLEAEKLFDYAYAAFCEV